MLAIGMVAILAEGHDLCLMMRVLVLDYALCHWLLGDDHLHGLRLVYPIVL